MLHSRVQYFRESQYKQEKKCLVKYATTKAPEIVSFLKQAQQN